MHIVVGIVRAFKGVHPCVCYMGGATRRKIYSRRLAVNRTQCLHHNV